MKVQTLRESLSSCENNNDKKKKKSKGEMIKSFFGHDKDEDGMNRTSRRSILVVSQHQQSFFGRINLDDDSDVKISKHKSSRMNKNLRFFDVEIREYSVAVSDNPTVRSGAGMEVRISISTYMFSKKPASFVHNICLFYMNVIELHSYHTIHFSSHT